MSKLKGPDPSRLAALVPRLAPEALHQLIARAGLDACTELVAAATPQQLTSVLDLDLWRPDQAGGAEHFNADRFGEWIETLVAASDTVAARIVATLDPEIVITGLSRYIRVFDIATFEPTVETDDEPMERIAVTAGGVECEVGRYLVAARRQDAWNAIVALLVELDAEHRASFHTLMQGCRGLSNSTPEIDGLDNLLMKPEQHLHDVSADREQRRSQQGYSSAADARAFLQLARRRKTGPSVNPIAQAFFRDAKAAEAEPVAAETAVEDTDGSAAVNEDSQEAFEAIAAMLPDSDAISPRPRGLLTGDTSRPTGLSALHAFLAQASEAAFLTHGRELAFLANALVAGCSMKARSFTPQEASDAAAATCNLGLEHWPAKWPAPAACDRAIVEAFELGWSMLYKNVTVTVTKQLIALLKETRGGDGETQAGLKALRRELKKELDAGTPWKAEESLDVLSTIDTPCWFSLIGLLSECPVIPAALTAIVRRQTGAVDAAAFDFISTKEQLAEIDGFVGRLDGLLRS